jgi:membrane fusion protein (multidrug efflux system)
MVGSRNSKGVSPALTWAQARRWHLLPPQNAAGNFVKVVQRLPVRIDIINYDPDKLPLFVGLSVEPSVDLKSKPTGPNAGKFLQEVVQAAPVTNP